MDEGVCNDVHNKEQEVWNVMDYLREGAGEKHDEEVLISSLGTRDRLSSKCATSI